MNFAIGYDRRAEVRTIAVLADLNLKDVEQAADRLRSWASIKGVPVAGPVFLTLASPLVARVCVPIGAEVLPHPETGLELDRLSAGVIARVPDVRFGEVRAVGRGLMESFQPANRLGPPEFHSLDGSFLSGDILLPLADMPQGGPAFLRFPGVNPEAAPPPAALPVRVVTLARQHGTGGEVIAESLARQLGFLHVDYEVVRRAAAQADVSPETIMDAARHQGRFARFLELLARGGPASPETWMSPLPLRASPLYTSAEYRAFVERAIRDLAEQGRVVLVGHGAQLVLSGRPDTLRVLITGSVERRAARAVAGGIPPGEAARMIREADAERVAYFREFYDAGWLDPSTYDLVVNTDRTSFGDAAGLILDAIKRRGAAREASATARLEPVLTS